MVNETTSEDRTTSATTKKSKRWIWAATGVLAALAIGTGTAFATGIVPSAKASEEHKGYQGATAAVEKGTLAGETSVAGTLKFADPHPVNSGFDGVATALPSPGDTVGEGGRLYTIGDQSAFLMRGAMPAWRPLSIDTTDGEDIRQLEQTLKDLGFFGDEPDPHFNWTTHRAVVAWQKSVGIPQDGILPLGRILFEKSDVRAGAVSARVGDQVSAGQALYTSTSMSRVVEAQVGLGEQSLAQVGARASLQMPDGTTTTGTIASVGTPIDKTQNASSGSGTTSTRVIPVSITPDDENAVASWQEASITIGLPSEKKENVLSVPVGALLALDPKTFGVEVVKSDGTTQKVPVTPGLFAAGRVEISGEGVHEGDNVAVPEQ